MMLGGGSSHNQSYVSTRKGAVWSKTNKEQQKTKNVPFVSSMAIFFPSFLVFVGAMIFGLAGDDVADSTVVG